MNPRALTPQITAWGWPTPRVPVVFVPGFLGDRRIFEPTARLLADRHGVLAVELPPGAPREAAAALEEQLHEVLGTTAARFVTGSYGGLVARCLPEARIRSLVTVGTAPARRFVPSGMVARRRALGWLPTELTEQLYRRRLALNLARDGVPEELCRTLARRGLTKRLLLERFDGVLDWDLPPWPDAPHLWLLGANDAEVRWTRDEILDEEPGVTLGTVPGGHRPYASHPGPFVTRLEDFWSAEGG